MTKELSESIMNTLRYNNRYQKLPAHKISQTYKKAKNLCNALIKEAKKFILKRKQKTESWLLKRSGVQSNLSFNSKAYGLI